MGKVSVISANDLRSALTGRRFNLANEKDLQQEIDRVFSDIFLLEPLIDYKREYILTGRDIPDFYFYQGQVAVEVKLKGQARKIVAQCERYCSHPSVSSLLLITNKAIPFPQTICGKVCLTLNLGAAWL